MSIVPKPVQLMNDVELIECLALNIGLSFYEIKKLFNQEIDGQSFLLMKKKHIAELGILDRYYKICMLFPMGKFVDDFI